MLVELSGGHSRYHWFHREFTYANGDLHEPISLFPPSGLMHFCLYYPNPMLIPLRDAKKTLNQRTYNMLRWLFLMSRNNFRGSSPLRDT